MDERIVSIFGTARASQGDSIYALAYDLGKALAGAGFTIANGGYGGTMLAAAKGASEAGGRVIGVTCLAFKSKANEYVSKEIVTNSLDERLDKLIELGGAYMVLNGGTGTLLELAKVWELKNKGFLGAAKPIILVGGFWQSLIDLLAQDDPDSSRHVNIVTEPRQAVEFLNECMI